MSPVDWLRLNPGLWKLTGETRFLDMAGRLIWNYFAMNQTANGGYGHHEFVCDGEGPLLMKPHITEAVWCCTFHGLLALHTLKSHVVAGSPRGVFINFPVEAVAPVQTSRGRWKVSVASTETNLGEIQCRVRPDPLDGTTRTPEVFVRRPSWAARVTIVDGRGRTLRARDENGYLRLSLRSGVQGEITLTLTGVPRVEDRQMRPVALDPKVITRHAGVTLAIDPHLLLANVDKPRPVLVARVGKDGNLLLPPSNRFPQAGSLDATSEQIARVDQSQQFLKLAPWEGVCRDSSVGFIFDLIAIPDDSPAAKPMLR